MPARQPLLFLRQGRNLQIYLLSVSIHQIHALSAWSHPVPVYSTRPLWLQLKYFLPTAPHFAALLAFHLIGLMRCQVLFEVPAIDRSEERRVGEECSTLS